MQMTLNEIVEFLKNCQTKGDLAEIVVTCKDGSALRCTVLDKDTFEVFFRT